MSWTLNFLALKPARINAELDALGKRGLWKTGLAAAGSGLKLSFARDTATLARSGSLYHGLVPIDCTGGSGNYKF